MAIITVVNYICSTPETVVSKLYIKVNLVPLNVNVLREVSQAVLSGCGIGLGRTHALREFHSASEKWRDFPWI
ncbi:hypothetical protein [Methanosarcina sp. 1.H.A.2.2]|uniref:hypothetical protein n=1 Tax=Methanosarcina sp. 1.H.A.2.2 TaxID=1483601 RepID=UPI000A40ADBB|nr:hypothetical protein [Methanosarcina sp. 1.H.A.2.2]